MNGFRLLIALATVALLHPASAESVDFYESHAKILVRPLQGAAPAEQDKQIASEVLLLQEKELLSQVATDLDLAEKWELKPREVLRTLEKSLKVERVRKTHLIDIRFRAFSSQEAREICSAILTTYIADRNEAERQRVNKAINHLDAELVKHKQEVRAKTEAYRAALTKRDQTKTKAAKAELEQAQASLKQLVEKQRAKRIDLKLPKRAVDVVANPS